MTNERTSDSIGLLECGNGKFQKVTLSNVIVKLIGTCPIFRAQRPTTLTALEQEHHQRAEDQGWAWRIGPVTNVEVPNMGLSSGVKNRYFKNPRLRSWEMFKTNVEAQAKPGGSILAQLVPSLNTNQQGSCTSELFPRENTLEALVKQRKACGGDDD
ncbi:hypothetical protein FOIG_03567 [Fusarium odoratissimum NRRL 54006]|uniref:Uncharacterized protein n=1 Tax=Fusarium odoratissimum (strain NRRL 54006) TaxID=1089451 RepID=X0KDY9_FUSO5|nr:uncharacterized protein FOIG_03567 [Fusarium odoratissimum NRRL 54006]EXM06927.1 hypothetical protein FOIG_03567 [Fusarium odoratissimum NRRL 54006]